MPESMTATVTVDPLNQSWMPSHRLSTLVVPVWFKLTLAAAAAGEAVTALAVTSASADTERTSGSLESAAISFESMSADKRTDDLVLLRSAAAVREALLDAVLRSRPCTNNDGARRS